MVSKLLTLQSKRLLLKSAQRRSTTRSAAPVTPTRVEQLRAEVEKAHAAYCAGVLNWGSPDLPEFAPVAYSRMIALAESLVVELRVPLPKLDAQSAYEVALEVEGLELLIDRWRDAARLKLVEAVA